MVSFIDGVAVDRIVGFDGLGEGRDDFPTSELETRLVQVGTIKLPRKARDDNSSGDDDADEERGARNSKVRHGFSRQHLRRGSDGGSSDVSA